jgi:hypothetical protein
MVQHYIKHWLGLLRACSEALIDLVEFGAAILVRGNP